MENSASNGGLQSATVVVSDIASLRQASIYYKSVLPIFPIQGIEDEDVELFEHIYGTNRDTSESLNLAAEAVLQRADPDLKMEFLLQLVPEKIQQQYYNLLLTTGQLWSSRVQLLAGRLSGRKAGSVARLESEIAHQLVLEAGKLELGKLPYLRLSDSGGYEVSQRETRTQNLVRFMNIQMVNPEFLSWQNINEIRADHELSMSLSKFLEFLSNFPQEESSGYLEQRIEEVASAQQKIHKSLGRQAVLGTLSAIVASRDLLRAAGTGLAALAAGSGAPWAAPTAMGTLAVGALLDILNIKIEIGRAELERNSIGTEHDVSYVMTLQELKGDSPQAATLESTNPDRTRVSPPSEKESSIDIAKRSRIAWTCGYHESSLPPRNLHDSCNWFMEVRRPEIALFLLHRHTQEYDDGNLISLTVKNLITLGAYTEALDVSNFSQDNETAEDEIVSARLSALYAAAKYQEIIDTFEREEALDLENGEHSSWYWAAKMLDDGEEDAWSAFIRTLGKSIRLAGTADSERLGQTISAIRHPLLIAMLMKHAENEPELNRFQTDTHKFLAKQIESDPHGYEVAITYLLLFEKYEQVLHVLDLCIDGNESQIRVQTYELVRAVVRIIAHKKLDSLRDWIESAAGTSEECKLVSLFGCQKIIAGVERAEDFSQQFLDNLPTQSLQSWFAPALKMLINEGSREQAVQFVQTHFQQGEKTISGLVILAQFQFLLASELDEAEPQRELLESAASCCNKAISIESECGAARITRALIANFIGELLTCQQDFDLEHIHEVPIWLTHQLIEMLATLDRWGDVYPISIWAHEVYESGPIWLYHAKALTKHQKLHAAETALTRAESLGAGTNELIEARAELLLETDDLDGAMAFLEQSAPRMETPWFSPLQRAVALFQAGEYDAADHLLEKIQTEEAIRPNVITIRALLRMDTDIEIAQRLVQELGDSEQFFTRKLLMLAEIEARKGHQEKAKEHATKAVEELQAIVCSEPTPMEEFDLGQGYYWSGQFDQSLRKFQGATRDCALAFSAKMKSCFCKVRLGDSEGAVEQVTEARDKLRERPRNRMRAEVRNARAEIYYLEKANIEIPAKVRETVFRGFEDMGY